MSARSDTVEQLALDRSATDFSAAGSISAAEADINAQTDLIDCLGVSLVDVIVEITNLGTGPATKLTVVGRGSAKAAPVESTAGDWSSINTEAVDTATGVSAITAYLGEISGLTVKRHVVTFPVRGRYFSALVWLDSGAASRGNVYFFRRNT